MVRNQLRKKSNSTDVSLSDQVLNRLFRTKVINYVNGYFPFLTWGNRFQLRTLTHVNKNWGIKYAWMFLIFLFLHWKRGCLVWGGVFLNGPFFASYFKKFPLNNTPSSTFNTNYTATRATFPIDSVLLKEIY